MRLWLFVAILILGSFLRLYQPLERFVYAHDSDLASWIVKDMMIDHHIRIIGQQTSESGIFIGPIFYYLLTPFYLFNHFDPAATVLFSWITGVLSMISLYYVMSKVHNPKSALIATLIYSVSFLVVSTDREIVPTTMVMLWTIWAYYAINRQNLYLIAILLSVVWHINLALGLLVPIFFVSVFKKLYLKSISHFLLIFITLSLPLIVFELRHDFLQSRALVSSLNSIEKNSSPNILHTLSYATKNANRIFYFDNHWPQLFLPLFLMFAAIWLTIKRKVSPYFFSLVFCWQSLFILFFTFHPINLSEYYLNGMNIIWIIITSLILSNLPLVLYLFIPVFVIVNFMAILNSTVNKVGYLYKKSLVSYIVDDARAHRYPCISVSYMTNPGYDLGYRYFFYLANLHVNQPKSGSPVYTIVFPHSRANRLDKTFGALGLIQPDYSKYNQNSVKLSCSGENSNLTDPMFGFTK